MNFYNRTNYGVIIGKAQVQKDRMTSKKEQQIDQMNGEQVMTELKSKRLPTFGTAAERRDRLRKFHGKSLDASDSNF